MVKDSREAILSNVRDSLLSRQKVEIPPVPSFPRAALPLKAKFVEHLVNAGGAAHDVGSRSEAQSKLMELHPEAKVICSAVPEIAGTRRVEHVRDPHELADVDVGVVRARFGVAETGAVWLTQQDLVVDSLGFLSQHLIVLLDPEDLATDMHEAYWRVELDKTAYGCFMMGPSATADVEATLVHGAQGVRSLKVFFLSRNAAR
jgi:L-lactate dehydrogenase complex protein LldG